MNLRPRRKQPLAYNTQQSRIPNSNNLNLDTNSASFEDVMAGRPIGSQAFIDKLQRNESLVREHSTMIKDWGNSWIVPFGKRQTQLDEEHDAEISIEEDYMDDADDDDEEELIEDGYEEGDLDDEIEDVDIPEDVPQSSPPDLDQSRDFDVEEVQDLDDDVPNQDSFDM
ncbi:hypothetical protein E3P88_02519 [Wallemia ichthyophaga]|uniref:Uncharacterized protein n=1 Tax=Wallemia ichthyophaga TaxID=245174 RepID=A0A4T0HAA2_WALIC|nr:hypothetical protein E3P94_02450 [Wallemia ichthyophaga]TIB05803.1 hypothetical protein E3P96_00915 [Wallemia ichthyophaga]TIB11242.1 hypothetical protein E3P90_02500 [Wallemia ichthyophaga]TIB12011.1 hypothetical protein E3P93_02397 [Wallemia ichthyophaga]TIB23450.1 hypothetical protein E3P88_02519 [Wallemia ichthyophaga]